MFKTFVDSAIRNETQFSGYKKLYPAFQSFAHDTRVLFDRRDSSRPNEGLTGGHLKDHLWEVLGASGYRGVRPPSALDIAMYFEDQNEWTRVLEEQWNRIGLGLPFSPDSWTPPSPSTAPGQGDLGYGAQPLP